MSDREWWGTPGTPWDPDKWGPMIPERPDAIVEAPPPPRPSRRRPPLSVVREPGYDIPAALSAAEESIEARRLPPAPAVVDDETGIRLFMRHLRAKVGGEQP